MVCPSCGTHNSKPYKFCPDCGQRLVPPAAATGPSLSDGSGAKPVARLDEAAQAARLLDQAFQLYDDAQYDEALGCCQASLALDPGGSTAHSLLGMIYERLGKTAEAVQQYQLVLQMNPDSIADAIKLETLVSRPGGSEQAQGVVLLGGEVIQAEQIVFDLAQPIVGAPQVEKRLLLRRIESACAGAMSMLGR